jgi:Ca-activated chloride channel family protein
MTGYNHLYRRFTQDSVQFAGVPLWLVFRCLPAIVMGSLLLLLLSAATVQAGVASESAEGDLPLALDNVESGYLLLQGQRGGRYVPALVHASKVHFSISGMVATVQVEQTFSNNTEAYMEGVYAFPLPDSAAVHSLEMLIGERRIVGRIRERAQAKKIYQAARKAGKKASLVEQQRPNLFTNRVANIGPGEEITVRMEYVQAVDFSADAFSLRFPMTITPRYLPGAPTRQGGGLEEGEVLVADPYHGWAVPSDQVPDAAAISPRLDPRVGNDHQPINPIEITAVLDMGMPLATVESPYHDIALSRRAGVYSISLVNGVSEMDRDFVLNWKPVSGATPQAALFTEKVGEDYFGLLMVVPPAAERRASTMPREVVFVVDTSGSMGGVSIEQARASLRLALLQLRPQDRFNIIEFNSHHRALYRTSMPADRHHLQQAQEFVRLLDASGGTEMLPALRAALTPTGPVDALREQAALRQVIFITDGAVGNETALFEALSSQLGSSRLFTVGIGSAPNSWFMRKAAEFGRGTHTHIGDLNEVGQKMAALFEQLAHPAAVNLQVKWPVTVEAWPQRIPDLYQGEPLSLAANFGANPPRGELLVSGEINGKHWQKRVQVGAATDTEEAAAHTGIGSIWARRKIAGLLDQKVTGRDEASVRAQVLPLALSHQLLSPYTSFVAVEEIVSRPVAEGLDSKPVANTRPRGQSDQAFAYPRTATTGPAKAWFGLLALFMALTLRILRQTEVDHVPAAPR